LTPREFEALRSVFLDSKNEDTKRWVQMRVDILNAPHYSHKDKRPYSLADFFDSPETRAQREQAERDRMELKRAQARDAELARKMIEARKDRKKVEAIEQEYIPSWARMTPEEKAARGL